MSLKAKEKTDLAIVGLGYVGLPLALEFAKAGCQVLGLDTDESKFRELFLGRSYIRTISADHVAIVVRLGKFSASCDFYREYPFY